MTTATLGLELTIGEIKSREKLFHIISVSAVARYNVCEALNF